TSGRRRSRRRMTSRASISSTPAARTCPTRTMCSPTVSTSAASSTTRPRSRPLGSRNWPPSSAPVPPAATTSRPLPTSRSSWPPLVNAATGEEVTAEELGGGALHSRISGVTDHLAANDSHALEIMRDVVSTLGPKNTPNWDVIESRLPAHPPEELTSVVPVDSRTPYDVHEVIARLVDGSEFHEFKAEYGTSLITGFAHLDGHPVGIVANNGILFGESALKGAHFIELCDQRGVPLIFLQNISGFMVGRDYEAGGIAKHGAKMVNAVATA